MISGSIAVWLWVFGGLTALTVLQALFPRWYTGQFNQVTDLDNAAVLYVRQAGAAIASVGALLIWAGFDPAIRQSVVVVALAGKAFFVASLSVRLKEFPGLWVTALVDAAAVLVFAAYLLGW